MTAARRRRKNRVPDALGGRLFGGPRRTAREFVTIVALVSGVVAVLVLETWQRVEMVETMSENKQLDRDLSRLRDLVTCRETALEQKMSRDHILSRARVELGLRIPEWEEIVFVANPVSPDGARGGNPGSGRPRGG